MSAPRVCGCGCVCVCIGLLHTSQTLPLRLFMSSVNISIMNGGVQRGRGLIMPMYNSHHLHHAVNFLNRYRGKRLIFPGVYIVVCVCGHTKHTLKTTLTLKAHLLDRCPVPVVLYCSVMSK